MGKSRKLLTLAIVSGLSSSILLTPLASAESVSPTVQPSNVIETSTSDGSVVLEKGTQTLDSNFEVSYEVKKEGDIITYNLEDSDGKKDVLTYNEKTHEFTLNGKSTDLNSILGLENQKLERNTLASIPSNVERTYKSPDGKRTGDLVKYQELDSTYNKTVMATICAGISAISKAPYSVIWAMLSAFIGTKSEATIYYKAQHYAIFDGTADKFVVTKFYSNPARTDLIKTTNQWEG